MTAASHPSVAIVTSTYRGDFERCRLLCDSIDARVTGHAMHYLLVEDRDRALFQALAGPRRVVLTEGELLPAWLRAVPDPVNWRRRLWLHPFGLPLRGWHTQQLRRIAAAARLEEAVMLSCDSDVVFVRPFAVERLFDGTRVHFHRVEGGVDHVIEGLEADHRAWSRAAGRLLSIAAPHETRTGYIMNIVPWRTDTAREMLQRIEESTRRPAMRALAATRSLSECTIYGRFVDEVEGRPDRHWPTARPLVHTRWAGEKPGEADLARFIAAMSEDEVALCIQSFIGADAALVRRAVKLD